MADKPNPFLLESNWRKDGGKRKRDSEDDVEIVLVEEKGSKVDCTVTDDDDIQADIDYAIALSLQESEETNNSLDDPRSIVDERLEYEDPHPNIHDLFVRFDAMFFGRRLINAGVAVTWGPRMTLCAGLCCYEGRGGLCSIKLSEPLLKLRTRKDLVETLLHEMIHALLFVTFNNKNRDSHGPEFISHMKRINELAGTNITVYHSFHDEVNVYRQHWWKCDGACQYRKPYYGIIRRAVNRAPSKNDYWWAEHQATCGGTFIKIKEPDNYSSKKKTSKKDERKQEKTKDIRTMLETSSKTDTHTTETHSGTGMETKTSRSKDESLKERREKMLKAAEKRLSKNKSKDIRTFTTTTSNQIVTPSNQTADSTPSNQEVASVLISRVDKRVCPVCGRDDIPEPILQPHITLCIDEMSNND